MSVDATTTSVGRPCATSRANVGPERNARRSGPTAGIVSATTCDMRRSDSSSMPLVAMTTIASRGRTGASMLETARRWVDGVTRITISAPDTAAAMSDDAPMVCGSASPGRKAELMCARLISSATSRSNAHNITSCSSRARWAASAVPQAPEPTTANPAMAAPYSADRGRGECVPVARVLATSAAGGWRSLGLAVQPLDHRRRARADVRLVRVGGDRAHELLHVRAAEMLCGDGQRLIVHPTHRILYGLGEGGIRFDGLDA